MVDYVTVVDTGSTDGTQDAVAATLAGTPHQLLEHPFEDFATTRNWALEVRMQAATTDVQGASVDA